MAKKEIIENVNIKSILRDTLTTTESPNFWLDDIEVNDYSYDFELYVEQHNYLDTPTVEIVSIYSHKLGRYLKNPKAFFIRFNVLPEYLIELVEYKKEQETINIDD